MRVGVFARVAHAVEQRAGDVRIVFVPQHVHAVDGLRDGRGVVGAAVVHDADVGVYDAAADDLFDRLRLVVCRNDDEQRATRGRGQRHSGTTSRPR